MVWKNNIKEDSSTTNTLLQNGIATKTLKREKQLPSQSINDIILSAPHDISGAPQTLPTNSHANVSQCSEYIKA